MVKSRKKQFAINVASGWLQQGSRVLVGFFTLPYALHCLGEEEYGIYQLAFSVIVFFNFLQVGMGPTLIRFSSRALESKDFNLVKKISSSAQFILGGLGLLGTLGLLMLIPFFINFYQISAELVRETSAMLICMALSFFFNFHSISLQGLLFGANRYELCNGVTILQNVLRVAALVLFFEFIRPSVFFYGVAILLSQIIRTIILQLFVFRIIGRATVFSFRLIDAHIIRDMVGFSLIIMMETVASMVVFQGPSLMMGKILGVNAVALFAPALLVATSMQTLIGQSLTPIVTMAAQEKVRGANGKLGLWATQISQLVACAGFGFLMMFFLFGSDFVRLWLGADKVWLWKVVAAVSAGAVLLPIQGVAGRMAIGAGNIKPSAYSQVYLAIVILSGSILGMLFGEWGIFGVAVFMGICISIRAVYVTAAYSEQFHYNFLTFFLKVYVRTACVAFFTFIIGFVLARALWLQGGFWTLFRMLVVGCVYLGMSWIFLLPDMIKSLIKKKGTDWVQRISERKSV